MKHFAYVCTRLSGSEFYNAAISHEVAEAGKMIAVRRVYDSGGVWIEGVISAINKETAQRLLYGFYPPYPPETEGILTN